jgi:hypothetical protein
VSDVSVRGNATAEELAAVLAVISRAENSNPSDQYARWRRARLAALGQTRATSRRACARHQA